MFRVRKTEETVNRCFRLPQSLFDKMTVIAQNENVSLNSFVVQCCEYAIEHFEKTEENK